MKDWFDWLTKEENREAVLAMIVAVTAFFGGLGWLYDRFTAKSAAVPGPADPSATVTAGRDVGTVQHQQVAAGAVTVQAATGAVVNLPGYTIEQHEDRLARREADLRAELAEAHDADRALLLAQIDEVRRQALDAEASFEARRTELVQAMAMLEDLAAGLPQTRLDAARRALAAGDDSAADEIFAEVEAMETAAISRAADAAYERGRIADADIRWSDAADHYARAARLAPTYDHLRFARTATWRAGDYAAALRFGEDLLGVAQAESGADSQAYGAALNEHALSLHEVGRFSEAEPLYRQALAIDEKTLGTGHPAYAVHLNNLAELLRETGRPAEAEPLYRQALAIAQKTLGTECPDYATHLNNLATLLWRTDRSAEAEPLYRQALAIDEKTVGTGHPAYAIRLNNLAGLLQETDRLAEAEPLFRQALAVTEKTLGTGHPAYATRLNNLAKLLWKTGRPAEAEPLFRQALAIDEKTLGTGHPAYAVHLNNLAELLWKTDRSAEAEPLYRQALAINEKTLGTGHPAYATHLNNLATLLGETGRPAEAEPLVRQALAILVTVYGEHHPSTRIVAANLAALGPDEAGGGVGTAP